MTFIGDFVYLYMTKQTCMQHVFYRPIYGSVPRTYNGTLSLFSSNKPRVVLKAVQYLSLINLIKPTTVYILAYH